MLREPTRDPNAGVDRDHEQVSEREAAPRAVVVAGARAARRSPGYMVNYGLGAVVTADMRQRIAEQLGPFETGNERWFRWLSQHLLSSGQTHETAELLRGFLGRPVSPQALLTEIGRMQKKKN